MMLLDIITIKKKFVLILYDGPIHKRKKVQNFKNTKYNIFASIYSNRKNMA